MAALGSGEALYGFEVVRTFDMLAPSPITLRPNFKVFHPKLVRIEQV